MNAPQPHPLDGAEIAAPEAIYAERCQARALLHFGGKLSLHDAVDELQVYAEASGLIDLIGQDAAQEIMGEAFAMVDVLGDAGDAGASPDEREGRDGDEAQGEACEAQIMLRAADLTREWEAAYRPRPEPPRRREAYRPPEATVQAFWYVASLDDPEYLAAWLAKHPADQPHLLQIWKAKRC